jgi:hypothetical protein
MVDRQAAGHFRRLPPNEARGAIGPQGPIRQLERSLNHRHSHTVSRTSPSNIRNGIGSWSSLFTAVPTHLPLGCLRVWHSAVGVKSGPMCWRCYGHCRHIHTVKTVISRATRNPSRSVIGCNLPSGVERVFHAADQFGKGMCSTVGNDSPKT